MTATIPVFRTFVPELARRRAADVMARGWLGYGPECRELESRFVRERGGFALATGSCTSALYLASLLARRNARAREVIVPSMTFVSTAMAFAHAGFRVRIADVDPVDLMLTPRTVAPLIGKDTAAVVAVHLYGQYCTALPALRALCDASGAALIEDCAHRLDLLDGRAPLGDYACYSFNAVKEVPCGEGGVLWGRDMRDEERARALSNVGLGLDTMQRAASARHADYQFMAESGLKLRLNDLAASLANGTLPSLAECRAQRSAQFARYDRLLEALAPDVHPLTRSAGDSCLMYVVRVPALRRDAIRRHLAERGVATSVHYPSLARHPLFCDRGHPARTPAGIDESLVTLPSFAEMTPAQQHQVVEALAGAGTTASEAFEASAAA